MSDLDKLNIYVPETLAVSLDRDAELFEVFKRDGRSINRNRFLSQVLLGYHDTYNEELSQLENSVIREIDGSFGSDRNRARLAHRIVQAITSPIPDNQRGKDFKCLSLKPTNRTEGLIREILDGLGNDNRSRYFYGMLASYGSKPSNIRECIVFKDNVDLLLDACSQRRMVSFVTTWDKKTVHRVVPYKLVAGQDERLNYLLCYEESNEARKAIAYRLCRIDKPHILRKRHEIPDETLRHLASMEEHGPQYAINDDEEACVRLCKQGLIAYSRIYFGRPKYDRIEETDDGDLYYFTCSKDQLLLYFKRFGIGEAEVVSPAGLRNQIVEFHRGALSMYD